MSYNLTALSGQVVGKLQEQEEIAGKLLSQFFGGGDDGGVWRWPRVVVAPSSTAGGTETLPVSRQAGHAEGKTMGTSYFCIHPSDFALALSSRLLDEP